MPRPNPCATCQAFMRAPGPGNRIGQCRRGPPTPLSGMEDKEPFNAQWPIVHDEWWCLAWTGAPSAQAS